MRRIGERTAEEIISYHVGRNDTPNFTVGQRGRVELAHFLIDKILAKDLHRRPLKFVEIGCGSGDITGPYSNVHLTIPEPWRERRSDYTLSADGISTNARVDMGIEVVGIDVVPQAAISCGERWPNMTTIISPVENLDPIECDLLVLCETLEHLIDPVTVIQKWLPKAKWAIIGHPLDEPDPPYEPGHNYSYTREDWRNWFRIGGHGWFEEFRFPMAAWDAMIMGHSARLDQPAWRNIHPDG